MLMSRKRRKAKNDLTDYSDKVIFYKFNLAEEGRFELPRQVAPA